MLIVHLENWGLSGGLGGTPGDGVFPKPHFPPFFFASSWHGQQFWRAFPIWGFPVQVEAQLWTKKTRQLKGILWLPRCPRAWGYFPSLLSAAPGAAGQKLFSIRKVSGA